MRFSNEAMRDTLLFLEENIKYENDKISIKKHKTLFSIMSIVENDYFINLFSKHKYTKDELRYTIEKMTEGHILNYTGSIDTYCQITDISFYGVQLIEKIRPETVWEKTKNIAQSIGNHSLKFIEDTAQQCAVAATTTLISNLTNSNK